MNDLGLTRLRVSIPSGVEGMCGMTEDGCYNVVNDDADPNHINWAGFDFAKFDLMVQRVVLPMKQLVEANGEKLFINLNYVHFRPQLVDLHANDPAEYAEFALAAFLHLQQKFGLVPDAWEAVLEPENAYNFDTGAKIGKAASVLKANGFTPTFIAPSNTSAVNAIKWYDDMITVPGVLGLLSELSYHRYRDSLSAINAALPQIAQRAQRDHIGTSMLEHIGSGVDDLYADLTVAQNVAWQEFTVAYPGTNDNGGQYYMINDKVTPPVITMASRAKLLRQYFKFIRPGAVRLAAASSASGLSPVAFANKNGKTVVVVKCDTNASFVVNGLPDGQYGINYTSQSEYSKDLPDQSVFGGQALTTQINNSGVVTIYGK